MSAATPEAPAINPDTTYIVFRYVNFAYLDILGYVVDQKDMASAGKDARALWPHIGGVIKWSQAAPEQRREAQRKMLESSPEHG